MRYTHTLAIGAIALAAVGAMGTAALADATVTSTVSSTSTGGPNGGRQQGGTVTVYYQGDSLRIETGNGSVMIYSGGKLYRVNASDQTYCLMPSAPKPAAPPPAGGDTLSFTATGLTSDVAGQSAAQYTVAGSGPAGPPPRPRQGGGDGPTSGPNDSGGPPPGPPPSAKMSGSIWLSDAVKIDASAKDALVIAIGHALGIRGPIAQQVAARLISMGEAPLSADITVVMPAMEDGTQPTMAWKSNVTSISTASLDSSLFTVPSGYTLVQGPPPSSHGPGGPGARGGPGGGGGPGGPPPTD